MRTILSIILILSTLQAFASPQEGQDRATYHFAYNLRTQYRYVDVQFSESGDSLIYHWSRKTDEGLRQGAFAMSKEAREHASQICYIMPAKGMTISVPDNELFAFLSRDAFRQLKQSGKCSYNNTTLTLLDSSNNLLHVKDFDEGYEMWIEDNLEFPLIRKMLNNPVEIDWEVIDN